MWPLHKQIAPALEQIATDLGGEITVAKLNIEESPTTPSRYGVRDIPTMMLFRDGQMASMKVGAMPAEDPGMAERGRGGGCGVAFHAR